jgi:hypothetical protein
LLRASVRWSTAEDLVMVQSESLTTKGTKVHEGSPKLSAS